MCDFGLGRKFMASRVPALALIGVKRGWSERGKPVLIEDSLTLVTRREKSPGDFGSGVLLL